MGSLGMLFYVVECFTVNLENLATDAVRCAQLCRINQQIQGYRGFITVALGKAAHEVYQVRALDAQGAEVGNSLAQIGRFVLNRLLKVAKGVICLFGCRGEATTQDVQLYLNTEKGLENAIVKVAGDAAALRFDGPCAQVPQKKDVFETGTDVLGNALKPS